MLLAVINSKVVGSVLRLLFHIGCLPFSRAYFGDCVHSHTLSMRDLSGGFYGVARMICVIITFIYLFYLCTKVFVARGKVSRRTVQSNVHSRNKIEGNI